ncbi:MAG: hypothetical protein JNM40_00815 [Myxococcales bacterium]|nr:hypothetical protein [Myxococcales bacterium]
MAQYECEIGTMDVVFGGTNANVFLSLVGDRGVLKETELNDPNSNDDWEKGAINRCVIQTNDLGWITAGTLRHDGSGPSPDWSVAYVKIINSEDGREWLAGVNTELKGNNPFRLVFKNTSRGQFDQLKRQKELEQERIEREQEAEDAQLEREATVEDARKLKDDWKAQAERRKAELKVELEKAKAEAEEAKLREEVARVRGAASGSAGPVVTGPVATGGMKTYEVFAVYSGRSVPLTQAINFDRATGRLLGVNAGFRVLVTDSASEGFGLAGMPGRWASFVGGSPASYGLDAERGVLAWDGSRGQVLNSAFLLQMFGSDWRGAVY